MKKEKWKRRDEFTIFVNLPYDFLKASSFFFFLPFTHAFAKNELLCILEMYTLEPVIHQKFIRFPDGPSKLTVGSGEAGIKLAKT